MARIFGAWLNWLSGYSRLSAQWSDKLTARGRPGRLRASSDRNPKRSSTKANQLGLLLRGKAIEIHGWRRRSRRAAPLKEE
jgi:hypothetical protein